jgi:hypothetical protein
MSYNSPFTGNVIQPTDVSYRAVTLSANTQLQWPINGNATDDYSARIMDVTATSSGLFLYMPPANQASVGNDALIRNVGSNSFTVGTYNGNGTIITVAAGEAKYIYIKTNNDEYGTWGNIAFGTGTSSADAASLAGLGLTAISSTLNQSHPTSALSNGDTFTTTDRAKMKVWSGGAGTVTLPPAATLTQDWFTLVKNNGTGTLTIDTSNLELLDGAITKQFQPNESAFIVNTGSEYLTVGYGINTSFFFSSIITPVTSGTYNITSTNATNLFQEFTGVLTGNVTVVYPPIVNFYVISNQTTDNGYTLTITTGLGGYNIVVPVNNQVSVVCDGTNFYNANTVQAGATTVSLPNGSVSAPSLNFAAETNTGIYRPGTGQFGITVQGTLALNVTSSGVIAPGGISGGVFV